DRDGLPNIYEYQHGLLANNARDAADDEDDDGLTNLQEHDIGTDPRNNDTESDGMDDHYEYLMDLDPLIDDANADSDGDGMPNIYECENGLLANKNDADEDKDGDNLSNYDEYDRGTDPTLGDTDGDGITDGAEVFFNTDPLDAADNPFFVILIIVVVFVSILGLFTGAGVFSLYRSRNRIRSWLRKVYGSYRPSETEIMSINLKKRK
ncbi:MAG: hypothetical protein ACXAEU_26605, partial [Candidatus Hodarchaeales archaeon]